MSVSAPRAVRFVRWSTCEVQQRTILGIGPAEAAVFGRYGTGLRGGTLSAGRCRALV
jgi:hypothetical protein